ncbi:hypothetical protein VSR68_27670 [Paraburkholderia phymatum]|uniref:hypothetical protein n=1 Tax=Paraburkholderia phymatum TaxID=148447 RepID=UPI0031791C4A
MQMVFACHSSIDSSLPRPYGPEYLEYPEYPEYSRRSTLGAPDQRTITGERFRAATHDSVMDETPRIEDIIGRLRLDGLMLINRSDGQAVSTRLVLPPLHLQHGKRDLESSRRGSLPLIPSMRCWSVPALVRLDRTRFF